MSHRKFFHVLSILFFFLASWATVPQAQASNLGPEMHTLDPEDVYWSDGFNQAAGVSYGDSARVSGIAMRDTEMCIGGGFSIVSGMLANKMACWDGSNWHALGDGIEGYVFTVAANGSDLYAGGYFTSAGGIPATNLARWDGSDWHTLGEGVSGDVYAMAISGTDVYVGGSFTTAGGSPANRIARWDGSAWHALGEGLDDAVETIAVSGSDVVPQRTFSGGRHGRSRPGSLTRRTTTDRWAAVNEIIDPKM